MSRLFFRPTTQPLTRHVEYIEELILSRLAAGIWDPVDQQIYYSAKGMHFQVLEDLMNYLKEHGYTVDLVFGLPPVALNIVDQGEHLIVLGIKISWS